MLARGAIAAAVCACWLGVPIGTAGQETTLAQAVREFNEKAKENPVGKSQPVLTEDEVVAAIRGWIRDRITAKDDVYGAYQKIAHTRSAGAELSFTTAGFNGSISTSGVGQAFRWVRTGYISHPGPEAIVSPAAEAAPPASRFASAMQSHFVFRAMTSPR